MGDMAIIESLAFNKMYSMSNDRACEEEGAETDSYFPESPAGTQVCVG